MERSREEEQFRRRYEDEERFHLKAVTRAHETAVMVCFRLHRTVRIPPAEILRFSTLSCGMDGFRLIRLGMWCFRFGWQGFEMKK